MPPRLNILSSALRGALSVRPAAAAAAARPLQSAAGVLARRGLADSTTTTTASDHDAASASPQEEQNQIAISQLEMVAYGLNPFDRKVEGHKFGLPELPLPSNMHKNYRYDDIVAQVTRLLMKDGKLGQAQRVHTFFLGGVSLPPPTPKLALALSPC